MVQLELRKESLFFLRKPFLKWLFVFLLNGVLVFILYITFLKDGIHRIRVSKNNLKFEKQAYVLQEEQLRQMGSLKKQLVKLTSYHKEHLLSHEKLFSQPSAFNELSHYSSEVGLKSFSILPGGGIFRLTGQGSIVQIRLLLKYILETYKGVHIISLGVTHLESTVIYSLHLTFEGGDVPV